MDVGTRMDNGNSIGRNSYFGGVVYSISSWRGIIMKIPVNWETSEKKIAATIKSMYKPGTKFVSTQFISEEIYKNGDFPGASYRTAVARVGTVLKNCWKFPVYAQKSRGAIFIVPDEWWKKRRGYDGRTKTPR